MTSYRKDPMLNWLVGLCFFPSSLYFIFAPNEIQPTYLIIAVLILVTRFTKITKKFNLPLLFLLCISLIYLSITFLYSEADSLFLLVNYLSYIAPLLLFLALRSCDASISPGLINPILYVWTFVSIYQKVIPQNTIGNFIESGLRFFIGERFSMSSNLGGGRGVQGLTAEPSGAAVVIILFVFFYRYFLQEKSLSGYRRLIWLSCLLVLFVCNSSGTLAILLLVYLALSLLFTNLSKSIIIVATSIPLCVVLYRIGWLGRVGNIVDEVLEFKDMLLSINVFYALTFFMGLRVYNWIYSYGSVVNNFGLGHGIGGWSANENMVSIVNAIGWKPESFSEYTNITYQSHVFIKPWSFGAVWVHDMGVIAAIGLLIFVLMYGRKIKKTMMPDFIIALIIIVLFPPISMGAPWVILGLSKNKGSDNGSDIS